MGLFQRLFKRSDKLNVLQKKKGAPKKKRLIVTRKRRGRPTKEIKADATMTFRMNKIDKAKFKSVCKILDLKPSFILNNICMTIIHQSIKAKSSKDLEKIRQRIEKEYDM